MSRDAQTDRDTPQPDYESGVDALLAMSEGTDEFVWWKDPNGKANNTLRFPADDPNRRATMLAALADYNARDGFNVYAQPSPLLGMPANKKSTRSEVARLRVLFVDIDADGTEGDTPEVARAKIDAAKAKALKDIAAYGERTGRPATLTLDTGNGIQAWWWLIADESLTINGNKQAAYELERFIRGLRIDVCGEEGGDRSVFDACRVLRWPGSVNWPDAKKRAKGRVPVASRVLDFDPSRRYHVGEFAKARPDHRAETADSTQAATEALTLGRRVGLGRPSGADVSVQDLRDLAEREGLTLEEHALHVITFGPQEAQTASGGKYPSSSEALHAALCGLVRSELDDDTILGVVLSPSNAIHAAVSDPKHAPAARYAAQQLANARKAVARDAVDDARRRELREKNRRIGDGDESMPTAEVIELEEALTRFVFCADGSQVVDLQHPHYASSWPDWVMTHAASKVWTRDADNKDAKPKAVQVSTLWKDSPQRLTVVTRTFKAGGPLMLNDPEGRRAVNIWQPFDRSLKVRDPDAAGLGLFLGHVAFLFGDEDAPRFLDWLAHLEQKPGVLPHTCWLHIATRFGLGRNWLASVLTRVWAGSVAASFDLSQTLKDGFNGRLSRKVLAIVDELREGDENPWKTASKIRSLLTEEVRTINPKYGRKYTEYNDCRWLMLSNYVSAMPMEDGERRIETVICDAQPQPPEYYQRLYGALDDPEFIAAVAGYLGERDISRFNPGAHAKLTAAKHEVIAASESDGTRWVKRIVRHWPCDVATAGELRAVLLGEAGDYAPGAGLGSANRHALEQANIAPLRRSIRIDGEPRNVYVVRNKAHWTKRLQDRAVHEVRAEWQRGQAKLKAFTGQLRKFLEEAEAQEGEAPGGQQAPLPIDTPSSNKPPF